MLVSPESIDSLIWGGGGGGVSLHTRSQFYWQQGYDFISLTNLYDERPYWKLHKIIPYLYTHKDRNFYILEISASPEKHFIILEYQRDMEHGMGITHGMGRDLEFTDSRL